MCVEKILHGLRHQKQIHVTCGHHQEHRSEQKVTKIPTFLEFILWWGERLTSITHNLLDSDKDLK